MNCSCEHIDHFDNGPKHPYGESTPAVASVLARGNDGCLDRMGIHLCQICVEQGCVAGMNEIYLESLETGEML